MKRSFKIFALLIPLTILFQHCDEPPGDCQSFQVSIEQLGSNILKANGIGGNAPYDYEWSTGSHLSEITVDSSGVYECIITDLTGCEKTATFNYTYLGVCSASTVSDVDGNVYVVVSIGNQCWMQQNLRVGAGMPEVSDDLEWQNLTTPGWCYYLNDNSSDLYYGRLYNWAAVNSGNLCPSGWHVATLDDWNELIEFLGGQFEAGGPLKALSLWELPNTGATNSSGFTAYGSGYRGTNGLFWDELRIGAIWTSTEYETDTSNAWLVTLSYLNTVAAAGWSSKKSGYSCRCVED